MNPHNVTRRSPGRAARIAAPSRWTALAVGATLGVALAVGAATPMAQAAAARGSAHAVAAPATSASASVSVGTQRFTDVPVGYMFYNEISWLAEEGITTGLGDGSFGTVQNVTREAMAAFLYRYSQPSNYTPPTTARFTDVPVGRYFYTEISWLAEEGITTGLGDGTFGALAPITREAMAAFLFRYAGETDYVPPTVARFPDVPVNHRFYREISWLAERGITNGLGDGRFGCQQTATRQEVAAFLYRLDGVLRPDPAPPSGGFPNASNTGVPASVTLTTYTGPMTITQPGTVIDAKRINGSLIIAAGDVTIKRSLVAGTIDSSRNGSSVTIVDSEIDGGQSNGAAIGYSNFTMTRVNVHGARISVGCDVNCLITDSWLHGQYLLPGSDWHVNGFLSNGGSNMTLRHNTLACEPGDNGRGGGCTGPAATFGDFARITNVTYDGNLFVAGPGSYCLYGGTDPSKPYGNSTTGVVVVNNVFERGANGKCAYYGPVGSFNAAASGNVWSNNTWDDGTTLRP